MIKNRVTVLVDNDSWFVPYANELVEQLLNRGLDADLTREHQAVQMGWINFILGCTRIVPPEILQRNQHNFVVHESDLPEGRGFAPIAWQILEGRNKITVCLIEAGNEADSGDIWFKDLIELDGTELCGEWRQIQGRKTVQLCLKLIDNFHGIHPLKQAGSPSQYPRRWPRDSRLDVDLTIREQFNLLRTVDNQRYPAFFEVGGQRYTIHIHKDNETR
jgi:methionyl-tRNA formyltransferase